MRIFAELIKARLENLEGAIAQVAKGLIYFRKDINRPQLDDGTNVSQLMLEKHLPEARRATKVQLDGTGTGDEIIGVMPVAKGGTNKSSLAGQAGLALIVNSGESGYEFGAAGDETIITGSFAAPIAITAVGGISISNVLNEVIIIEGDGGPVNITANPQIEAPTVDGSRLTLFCADAVNIVTIEDGDGLTINGPYELELNDSVTLIYLEGQWRDLSVNF